MPDINELKERIAECKNNKQELNDYVHSLNAKFKNGEIDYTTYFLKYGEITKERSFVGWNEYYDNEIKECERELIKLNREETIAKVGLFIIVAYLIVFIGMNQLDLQTPTSLTVYDTLKHITPLNDTQSFNINYTFYDIIKKQ